jgi:hypothetical protein
MKRLISQMNPGLLLLCLVLVACSPANRPSQATAADPGALATPAFSPAAARATTTATATPAASQTPLPTPLPTVSPTAEFDPGEIPQGEWVYLGKMPSARSEMPAAATGGLIYVAGGFGNPGMDRGNVIFPLAHGKALEIFDPLTNLWREAAPMPEPRHHLQVAAHDGRVYVFGGSGLCQVECGFQETAWVYDPESDTWTELAPMPYAISAGAAVSLPDGLYLVGGLPDTSQTLLHYDPVTGEWRQKADMLEAREHVTAAAYQGKIYLFGGRWLNDLRSMEIYDPATNTWTAGPEMSEARGGHTAAVVGDRIYVIGGENILSQEERVVDTMEVYVPGENRWLGRIPIPKGLHGAASASVDGVLYLIGGSSQVGEVRNSGEVWAYRP